MSLERALKRPLSHSTDSARTQWATDKALGILDWDPTPEEAEEYIQKRAAMGDEAKIALLEKREKENMAMFKCNQCGKKGSADEMLSNWSPIHDGSCPECGTTDLDTSGINQEWARQGKKYGFGDDNCAMSRRG